MIKTITLHHSFSYSLTLTMNPSIYSFNSNFICTTSVVSFKFFFSFIFFRVCFVNSLTQIVFCVLIFIYFSHNRNDNMRAHFFLLRGKRFIINSMHKNCSFFNTTTTTTNIIYETTKCD
jgi:hypothetical protein